MNDEETALLVIGGAAALTVAAIVFSGRSEPVIDKDRLSSDDPRRYSNGPIINSEQTYLAPNGWIHVIRQGTLPNGTQGTYYQELFYFIGPVVMNQQLVYNKDGKVWYIDAATTQLIATNWQMVVDYTQKSWYLLDPTTGEKWTKVGDGEMQHIPAPTGDIPGGDMPTGDQPIRRDPVGGPTLLGYPSASR